MSSSPSGQSLTDFQDFKDMIRREDIDVVHVDAHKLHKHQGVVKFKTYNDLKRAVKKFQHREIEGRRLEITETRAGSRDRSGSRDSSDRKSSSRKRYRSRSVSSASTSPRPKKKAPTSPLDRAKSKDTTTATKTSSPHRPVTPEGRSSSERSTSRSRGPRLPTVRSSSSSSSGSASPPKTPGSP